MGLFDLDGASALDLQMFNDPTMGPPTLDAIARARLKNAEYVPPPTPFVPPQSLEISEDAIRSNAMQPNIANPPMQPPFQSVVSEGNPNVSPISPEFLAKNAAARGVPPPPVDIAPGDVGAALTGRTMASPVRRPQTGPGAPMDITSEAQKASVDGAPSQKPGNGFMDALKGVKAPTAPQNQRISTPAAPRLTASIKGGDIIALLQSLNAGGAKGGLDLPSTLGQALMRK